MGLKRGAMSGVVFTGPHIVVIKEVNTNHYLRLTSVEHLDSIGDTE